MFSFSIRFRIVMSFLMQAITGTIFFPALDEPVIHLLELAIVLYYREHRHVESTTYFFSPGRDVSLAFLLAPPWRG